MPIAICNKLVAICIKAAVAFCNRILSQFVISQPIAVCNNFCRDL